MKPTDDRDDALRLILQGGAPATGAGQAGPCPDENDLAAAAEGRLDEARRPAVLEHLAACERCRVAVAAVAADTPTGRIARPRRTRVRLHALAAAAAIVVAGLLVIALLPRAGSQELLIASARELADKRSDLLAGFEPYSAAELAGVGTVLRGGLALHDPAGAIDDVRPRFTWDAVAAGQGARLRLLDADGAVAWEAECAASPCEFPEGQADLVPGARYSWRLAIGGSLGLETATRAFRVTTPAERKAHRDAVLLLEQEMPSRIRALARAQLALRHERYAEAEAAAAAYLREHPGDEPGRLTLQAARRARGL